MKKKNQLKRWFTVLAVALKNQLTWLKFLLEIKMFIHQQIGRFLWHSPLQGVILSCYFWGYFVSQIPGARVAEHFSAKYVMLFSVAINVICTILTPVAAKQHYIAMILMRIGEGMRISIYFGEWEKSKIVSFFSAFFILATKELVVVLRSQLCM